LADMTREEALKNAQVGLDGKGNVYLKVAGQVWSKKIPEGLTDAEALEWAKTQFSIGDAMALGNKPPIS
jgi:hypothetical protein